jgi:N-acetylmuramic acid 6-phosphate etherase
MAQFQADTEQVSEDYRDIDTWPNADILAALVSGQERALTAVRDAIPQISKAANALEQNLTRGGKLFYAGAGTSIRIAVQDGSELPSTFGMPEDKIGYLIAGGRAAMFETLADAEDDIEEGAKAASVLSAHDTLVAVAASGTTAYTIAAAKRARQNGATVIAMVNNPASPLAANADFEICLNSGPEVIAGSTRMGAGTAQKAALNLLSTLTHIKLGAVYHGMMVNVQAGNSKLRKRAQGIVAEISGRDEKTAAAALEKSSHEVKPAILLCSGVDSVDTANQLLAVANGNLRAALKNLDSGKKILNT